MTLPPRRRAAARPPDPSPDASPPLSSPWTAEIRATCKLAGPVVVAQVGMMAMNVVDIAMVGRVSTEAVAAVALGHVYSFGAMIFGMGALQALDPLLSQALAAGEHRAIGANLQRGLVLALLLGVPTSALLVPAAPVFALLKQPPETIPLATAFVHASIPGVLPFLLFVVLRQSLQALSRTGPIVVTVVVANLANAGLNWVLIWGNLGAPALGAAGSAWATSLCRWLLVGLLLALGWPVLRPHLLPLQPSALAPRALRRMLRLGAPIGGAFVLEYGAFMITALFMGQIGERELAGHHVAMNLAALSFMFPLGISAAAAVRVGYAVGRADPVGARRAGATSLVAGVAVMALFAVLFLTAPRALAAFYSDQLPVVAAAALLIPLAGVFQVFDGVQVVAAGVLRGLGDTRTPMLVHLLGFWLIGIPLGQWLAFGVELGPRGLWWGLVAGLAAVATILLLRVRALGRRGLVRTTVDE